MVWVWFERAPGMRLIRCGFACAMLRGMLRIWLVVLWLCFGHAWIKVQQLNFNKLSPTAPVYEYIYSCHLLETKNYLDA